ncbi:MAG: hypothetical protein K6E99_01990 [Bacilli bacterium]|nr:hypothetical protein [Bacilli bacterium]
MKKEIDQSVYEQVGHIRIKESKKKNKKNKSGKAWWEIILTWGMLIAMTAAFVVPLILYFIRTIGE